jgi:F0F1-type ATP synthase membrane subunit b/b'
MLMILQDNDPHHMHPDFSYVFYFVILAVIFAVAMLFAAPKVMNYLDNRHERKKRIKENSETTSEDDRRDGQ